MNVRMYVVLPLLTLLVGCQNGGGNAPTASVAAAPKASVFVSVVSDMESNPQAVDMALKFAGFALDENRDVFLFFTVKGVNVPLRRLPADAAFQDNAPIQEQLRKVIERGAKAHVCPVCMKAHKLVAEDLVDGAQVTTRAQLFEAIHANTTVFTF